MRNELLAFCAVLALTVGTAAAQDARSVLQAAATTMGATNLKSIQYSWTGWEGAVGQNYSLELDWPRSEVTGRRAVGPTLGKDLPQLAPRVFVRTGANRSDT